MNYKRKIYAWYIDHTPRERQLLVSLAVVVSCFALYCLIWAPSQRWVEHAGANFRAQQALSHWVEANAPLVRQSAPENAGSDESSIATLLTDTAREQAIAIKRLELNQDGYADVTFEQVKFSRLVAWLDVLDRHHHIVPSSMNVTAADQGMVSASFQMRR